ncbi:MAG: hypothetical protein ACYC96_13860 [Fimbriimonadaceae bacterium]
MCRALFLPGLALLAISGCHKATAAFVGKWQLDTRSVKSSDPKVAPDTTALGLMVLDFKPDKTFVLSSKTGDQQGTFDVDGENVTMHLSDPKSSGAKKPILGKLSADGKFMNVTGGGSPLSMKFAKL